MLNSEDPRCDLDFNRRIDRPAIRFAILRRIEIMHT
jgi:hypothetical protein